MPGKEVDVEALIQENVALRQELKELTGRDLQFRLINLHEGLIQDPGSDVSSRKMATLCDGIDDESIIEGFELTQPLRDLLLEDNPNRQLEVSVSSGHRYILTIKNASTGNFLYVHSGMRPRVMLLGSALPDSQPSQVFRDASDFCKGLISERKIGDEYAVAKKLIGVAEGIARFNDRFGVLEMTNMVQQFGSFNPDQS